MSQSANKIAVMAKIDPWAAAKGIPAVVPQQPHENLDTYVRVWLLEGDPVIVGVGGSPTNQNQHVGILQMSVFSPLGQGEGYGLGLAEELIGLFRNSRYSGMVFQGGTVREPTEDEGHMRHDADMVYEWYETVQFKNQ